MVFTATKFTAKLKCEKPPQGQKKQEDRMSFVEDNFELLYGIGQCIAEQFGPNCEVVLHDLTRPYESTIVAIWNGHVTGREVGGGGTDAGLKILKGTSQPEDTYNYINSTKSGQILRSSSKYIKDKEGNVVGSLCINFDITDLLKGQNALSYLTNYGSNHHNKEVFTSNIDELLDEMIYDAVSTTGKEVNQLTKEEKVEVVKYLDEKGAFLIKKSAERVADFLGITRFTIYNYLKLTDKK